MGLLIGVLFFGWIGLQVYRESQSNGKVAPHSVRSDCVGTAPAVGRGTTHQVPSPAKPAVPEPIQSPADHDAPRQPEPVSEGFSTLDSDAAFLQAISGAATEHHTTTEVVEVWLDRAILDGCFDAACERNGADLPRALVESIEYGRQRKSKLDAAETPRISKPTTQDSTWGFVRVGDCVWCSDQKARSVVGFDDRSDSLVHVRFSDRTVLAVTAWERCAVVLDD